MTPERLAELETKAKHPEWKFAAPKATILDLIAHIRDLEAQVREAREKAIDAGHLERQRQFSAATFGPGPRTAGVLDHIRKELNEIEADPLDLREWVDVIILAFDGAWRAGWEPQAIIDAVKEKQRVNEAREWPDWRTASPDHAIEHVRTTATPPSPEVK